MHEMDYRVTAASGNIEAPIQGTLVCPHPGGEHRIGYIDWNRDANNGHVLFCLHGVTRNSRDFDFLARALANRTRVVSMDYVGHGKSDWLEDTRLYQGTRMFETCIADTMAVLAHLGIRKASFIGTSMGGYMAALIACYFPQRTESLIINDTSPVMEKRYLTFLTKLFSSEVSFSSREVLGQFVRYYLKDWGDIEPHQWDHLVEHTMRPTSDGGVSISFDRRVMTLPDVWTHIDFSPYWRALTMPVLILRGEQSNVLDRPQFEEMVAYGANFFGVEFPGCGHAPSLMRADHHATLVAWLDYIAQREVLPAELCQPLPGSFLNLFQQPAAAA
jgi:pimeloyl-ACP methyl ester carboxylesterase